MPVSYTHLDVYKRQVENVVYFYKHSGIFALNPACVCRRLDPEPVHRRCCAGVRRQKADFTFYGGIYRDVSLMVGSKNHVALDDFGGPGIRSTPTVQGTDARW